MKEMCTRNELNLILQAMTQAYQAVYGANVVKIILYGSYARGDYQKDSDIDIVVHRHCSQQKQDANRCTTPYHLE